MGLNEFAGYGAVSLATLASGYLSSVYGLRPVPFYLGIGFAILGLFVSTVFIKDTTTHAQAEAQERTEEVPLSFWDIFQRTSWKDRNLFACSQAGLVNNLNDGMAWGLFPLFFASAGLDLKRIGILAAVYPAVWGMGQLLTGALSDRLGRKWLIASGMWVQAVGIWLIIATADFLPWLGGAMLLGVGTALVYPTLLAAIGDVVHPSWRASSVGVYRMWRDLGYAIGALVAGAVADLFGLSWSIGLVGLLTFISGIVVAAQMQEDMTIYIGKATFFRIFTGP
jgi:MFS family permease